MKTRFASILLLFTLVLSAQKVEARLTGISDSACAVVESEKYYRTELYFGRSIPGGGLVTDEQWEQFLAEIVTPRFPDGFTILKGVGQYREKSGKIISEPSQILVFLYASKSKNESRAKIEEIRKEYVKRFKQESVMRVDFPRPAVVSF